MKDPLQAIKPEVRNLIPYTLRDYSYQHKMNQNENPFGFPLELKEEVWRRVREQEWARYPDFTLRRITEAIARYAELPSDWVLVGNGSNELIQATLMVTLSRGDRVVIAVPTFTLYRITSQVMGAEVIEVRLQQSDFSLPVPKLVAQARDTQTKLVILCSPNNPTGNIHSQEDIRRVIEETGALVIIDEAYRDFSEQNLRPLLDEYHNLVLLRTFSKAMALAGLRLGYLLARPEVASQIAKAKLPYGLNLLSEMAALVALENVEILRQRVEAIRKLREELYSELKSIPGVYPYPSQANFILCRFALPVEDVFRRLLEGEGVLVRDVSSYPMLEGHLRLSVGTQEENQALLRGLRSIFMDS